MAQRLTLHQIELAGERKCFLAQLLGAFEVLLLSGNPGLDEHRKDELWLGIRRLSEQRQRLGNVLFCALHVSKNKVDPRSEAKIECEVPGILQPAADLDCLGEEFDSRFAV